MFLALSSVLCAEDTVPGVKKITVLETNNLMYDDHYSSLYLPKSPADAELRKLKQAVLSKIKVTSKDEFSVLLELLAWVNTRWEHDAYMEPPPNATSYDILQLAAAGSRFRCQEYAQVYHDILSSFGYVSRVLQLRSSDAAYSGLGAGHVAVEVYSNVLGKWMFFDPQMCSYVTKSDNVPLSFLEIYKTYADGAFDSLLVHTSNAMLQREKVSSMDEFVSNYKTFLRKYFGYVGTLSMQARERVLLYLKLDGRQNFLTFQGIPVNHRMFTEDADNMYFPVNRTVVLFDYGMVVNWQELFKRYDIRSAEDYLANMAKFAAQPDYVLTLKNSSPWFSHYEVRIDDGAWSRTKGEVFHWSLKEGVNEIHVRSVNTAGVPGPETFARIRYGADPQ